MNLRVASFDHVGDEGDNGAACRQLGMDRLKPLKEALPPEILYEEIRLVIARLRTEIPSR